MEMQKLHSSSRRSLLHSWEERTAELSTSDTWRIHQETFA